MVMQMRSGGVRPLFEQGWLFWNGAAGDDVLDPAAVANPNFGCTCTDKMAPRLWNSPGLGFLAPAACPAQP